MSIWTEQRLALLIESFQKGHTRDQTAGYVSLHGGLKVSRSACIGKLYRMGYVTGSAADAGETQRQRMKIQRRSTQAARDRESDARRASTKPKARRMPRVTRWDSEAGGPPLPLPPDEPLPTQKLKTLFELESGMCKWPYGDPRAPGFGFCGEPIETGMPYCVGHCRRAYAPPIPKPRLADDQQPAAAPSARETQEA